MTDNSIKYDEKLIKRLFYSLMPTAIIIMLSNSINSIVDGIIASNFIGKSGIAAIGFYSPFINILIGISAIFSGGSLIIAGNRLGRGDEKGASEVFSTNIIATTIIFLLINIIMYTFAKSASIILGADSISLNETTSYIKTISFSYLPLYLGNHLNQFLELEQKHLRNYIAIASMIVLNIIMDLLLVSRLNLGCSGLGLATTISSWAYFLILLQYYFTSKAQLKINLSCLNFGLLPEILVIGAPGALLQIYIAIRGYIYNKSIIYYVGEDGIAAFAAANSFACIFFALSSGIGAASKTLFSIFVGAKDRESIRTTMKVAIFNAFPINVGINLIFILLAEIFTKIYFVSPSNEYNLALELFRICPLALAFSTIGIVFSGLYQCQNKMKLVNIISAVDGLIGVCISLILLCPLLKITGVWLAWFTSTLFVMLVIVIYTILKLKRLPKTLYDWLSFNKDFGVQPEQRLNLSVHNESEVVLCSKTIMEFLSKRGRNNRQVYYTGLALEEMAGNIILHGYKVDNKTHNITIECIDFEDKLVLHIMDDCTEFDPLSKDLIFNPDDPAKNIGIRMVQKISKEFKYYRMIGINVLTIII